MRTMFPSFSLLSLFALSSAWLAFLLGVAIYDETSERLHQLAEAGLDEVWFFPSMIAVFFGVIKLICCGSNENVRFLVSRGWLRLLHGLVLSTEKYLGAVCAVGELNQIRCVGIQECSVSLAECQLIVIIAAIYCRLKPPFWHWPVGIFWNHQIGLEGQQDGLVARLAECRFVTIIVPFWRKL